MDQHTEKEQDTSENEGFQLRRLPWKRIAIGAGLALAASFLLLLGIIWYLLATAPDIDSITVSPMESATYICDEDGNYLRKLTLAASNRDIVSLDEIPETLQHAVIAIEDERFYKHGGIDLRGIARAFWSGITSGSFSEGASTITQQLIKNNVFTEWTQENSFRDRFGRKIQEQYLALQLEDRMEKDEILEHYLNTINLGAGCYGVQAASRRYFGKDVSQLTLSECAVLAAIPQNPSGYNPIVYPQANQKRAKTVLRYMTEQGYISQEEQKTALEDDVYARIRLLDEAYEEDSAYTYYEDALIDQVIDVLISEKGYTSDQAYRAVYSGGLRIFSAQDDALQQICDEEFQNPENFPEGTQFGIDYALSIADENGLVTHYGSDSLRSYIRQTQNDAFNLLCSSQEEAEGYADAFRSHILAEASASHSPDQDGDADGNSDRSGKDSDGDSDSPDKDSDGNRDDLDKDSDGDSDGPDKDSDGNRDDLDKDSDGDRDDSDKDSDGDSDGPDKDSDGDSDDPDKDSDGNASGEVTVLGERLTLSPQPQASLVLVDQHTGFVRAVVGGRGEKTASLTLNRATETLRQPGSTFKILTAYAPAIDAFGQTLATLYENEPYQYKDGTPVSNWDITDYSGTVSIREAITRSINVVAVKCITEISPRVGFEYAQKFGITTLHESYETAEGTSSDVIQPLALGGVTQGVTNLELCGAYAAIANGGYSFTPRFFTKILDRHGEVILDYSDQNASSDFTKVLQEGTAFLLTSAMQDVVSDPSGTAYGSIFAAGQPIAGKTGTTSNYKDIWFVGYTPYYTCSVWGGYDNNQDLPDGAHTYSKVLWSSVMNRIHSSLPAAEFEQPDNVIPVTLCRTSRQIAVTDACPESYTEYFISGTEPKQECTLHEPAPETEPITIYPDILDQLLPETEASSETDTGQSESGLPGESETLPGNPDTFPGGSGSPSGSPDSSPGDSDTLPGSPGSSPDGSDTLPGSPDALPGGSGSPSGSPDSSPGGSDTLPGSPDSSPDDSGNSSSATPQQPDTTSFDDLMNRLTGQTGTHQFFLH